MRTKSKKPGPEPERLVVEGDPGEALDRLLGKEAKMPGEWRPMTELPPENREVEIEDDLGRIRRRPAGGEYVAEFETPGERHPKAVRWRFVEDGD